MEFVIILGFISVVGIIYYFNRRKEEGEGKLNPFDELRLNRMITAVVRKNDSGEELTPNEQTLYEAFVHALQQKARLEHMIEAVVAKSNRGEVLTHNEHLLFDAFREALHDN